MYNKDEYAFFTMRSMNFGFNIELYQFILDSDDDNVVFGTLNFMVKLKVKYTG